MLLFTVIVLVVALIYFLFLIYWAIIASTKTPSQLTSCILTIPQYSIFHALHLINTMLAIIIPCCVSPFGFFLGRVYAQTSMPNELLEHSGRFWPVNGRILPLTGGIGTLRWLLAGEFLH